MENITFTAKIMNKNKEGLYGVYIRITQNRKSEWVKVGISIKKSDWGGVINKWVRSSNDEFEFYNSQIEKKIEALRLEKKMYADKPGLKTATKDFMVFYNQKLHQMRDEYNQAKGYVTTKNKITEYLSCESIKFTEMDCNWLKEFELWLKKNGWGGSAYTHQKRIRAIWNKAIKEEVVGLQFYPFKSYTMPKDKETAIERLETDELIEMFSLQYEKIDLKFWVLKSFELSFNCAGIRIEDLLCLKYSNIKEGRIEYQMKKGITNGTQKSFKINEGMKIMLDSIKRENSMLGDYLFPFLEPGDEDKTNEEYKKIISAKTALCNKYLKFIAKDCDIEKNITNKIARHSWALYTYEQTGDIRLIQDCLGHKNIHVTEIYLGKLQKDKSDAALDKVSIYHKMQKLKAA